MSFLSNIADKLSEHLDRESKKILKTLQAHSETELLVKLGSELAEYSTRKGVNVDDVDMEDFATSAPLMHVPIYGKARNAIAKLDEAGEDLVKRYASQYIAYKPSPSDIKRISFSGGGGKANFYQGALSGLEKIGIMNEVNHVAGASAGAITALPVALGYDANEIDSLIKDKDFKRFFYNSSSITRSAAKIGGALSTLFPQSQMQKRLDSINEGNYILEAVHEHTAKNLDKVIFDNAKLKQAFDSFLTLADVDAIKLTLDQTRDKSDLLMNRVLEQKKEHRLFNEEINSYKSSRLDNRARGDIWIHQYGKDPLSDRIHDFQKELLYNDDVQDLINNTRDIISNKIGYDPYKSTSEVLTVAVRMRRGQHQIESTFGDIIEEKMDKLVDDVGTERLIEIDERLATREGRRQITLQAINDIADMIPESGFKHLDIAVTKGESLSSIFNGEGVIVDHTKKISSLDPVVHIVLKSLTIPIVFNTVRSDLGNYVDGGLFNNLPTKHFDERSGGFDKSVLSIVPVTEKEANNNHGFNNIWGGKFKRLNKAYDEMSIRESFRTVIVNTGKYDTLDFEVDSSSPDSQFEKLVDQARDKIVGNTELNIYGVFDRYYNAQLSFLDSKLMNYQEKTKFEKVLQKYNDETIKDLAERPPFQHVANRNSILELFDRSKQVKSSPEGLTQ